MRASRITLVLAFSAAASAGAQQPAQWRLVEEWRVGGAADGPHFFGDPRGLGVTPNGGIVVLEYKDQQVHFLDARGQPVRTVGRKGAGPGEFRQANGLRIAPSGEVVINDPSNVRFTVLSPTGDLVKTVRYPDWGFNYYWEAHFNTAGRLDEWILARKPGTTTTIEVRRVWNAELTRADTIMPAECPSTTPEPVLFYSFRNPDGRGGGNARYPFIAPRNPRVFMQDGTAWTGRYPEYRVVEQTTFGKCGVNATIQLSPPAIAVPRAQYDTAVAMITRASVGQGPGGPDPSRVPRTLPHYERMFVDAANRLWLSRLTGSNLKFTNNVPSGDSKLHVFSASGTMIAEAAGPVAFTDWPTVITNDRIYTFVRDQDDVLHLVALQIVRN